MTEPISSACSNPATTQTPDGLIGNSTHRHHDSGAQKSPSSKKRTATLGTSEAVGKRQAGTPLPSVIGWNLGVSRCAAKGGEDWLRQSATDQNREQEHKTGRAGEQKYC